MTVQKLSEATRPTGVGRRTLVTGTAWAVPVVAVSAPSPAAAATPICVVDFAFGSGSCKCPGTDSTYTLNFCATDANNCVAEGAVIYVWDVQFTTGAGGSLDLVGGGSYPIAVPIGGCSQFYTFTGSGNSANYLAVVYSFTQDGERFTNSRVPSPPSCPDGTCV